MLPFCKYCGQIVNETAFCAILVTPIVNVNTTIIKKYFPVDTQHNCFKDKTRFFVLCRRTDILTKAEANVAKDKTLFACII